jgi:hypothetical protein
MGRRLMLVIAFAFSVGAQTLPDFDFTKDISNWVAVHDLAPLENSADGVVARITGADPYMHGPARDYPAGQPLWANIRIKSDSGGGAQVFYFTRDTTEEHSVRFHVPAGAWADLRVPFPALGPQTRLRIDPPGASGTCVISRISFEARSIPVEPHWATPTKPSLTESSPSISSGELKLIHGDALGAFEIKVVDQSVAIGNARSMVGYTLDGATKWMEMTNATVVTKNNDEIIAVQSFNDSDGARWRIAQVFRSSNLAGAFDVETSVTIDTDRSVVFLPFLTLLPGVGAFGTNKTQGVFAGLEFLENEPSSSEADIIGPGARRKVPDPLKVTFPLMALSANDSYVGLIWEQAPDICPLFDSPDRTFKSGGHAMTILFPGANPAEREDGSILPYGGKLIRKGNPLVARATIIGGRGHSTIPAVQEYVKSRGLPPLPNTGYSAEEFYELEAHGWLDSKIRDGARFRHAVGNNFGSAAVADAPMFMDWLAEKITDANLTARLKETAKTALALVPAPAYNSAAIGHIRHPAEALIFGSVAENAATALAEGRGQVGVFQPNGAVLYSAPASGNDLAKTHWSREANGLAATHVSAVLERAAFSGDRALISEGIRLLHALDKFRDTVPRGAQTWEVPLHTPDILASAYLVRAYLMGYELAGESDFLAQAKYWAFTGVPFVYLTPPTPAPVGVYSTTPVFGATQWVAPNWIGLPVQWCGLVYGDAIRRLARFDPEGPWLQLANGIAAAGIQHCHTSAEPDKQGLLPDSFDLRAQQRNPVPINPATLLPEAIQTFGDAPLYDFWSFREHKILVHAPGPITNPRETGDEINFHVDSWKRGPWRILLNGLGKGNRVLADGKETTAAAESENGRVFELTSPAEIKIEFGK